MNDAKIVAAALAARLATIRTANGYLTEIGAHVFRGKRSIDPETELPAVVLGESDDSPQEQTRSRVRTLQRYVIEGHHGCDPDNPNDTGHDIVSDIVRAVMGGDRSYSTLVRSIRYQGRSIMPRTDGLPFVAAQVEFDFEFSEDFLPD